MGLFAPAWKSKNAKKSMKAVEKAAAGNDQATLWRIVLEASLEDARIAAVNQLRDMDLVYQTADEKGQPSGVRLAALNRISDQDKLCRLVSSAEWQNNPSEATRLVLEAALKKLDRPHLVEAIGDFQHGKSMESAMPGLTQAELCQVAQNNHVLDAFQVVLGKITDPKALEETVACNYNKDCCLLALKAIRDKDAFARAAARYHDAGEWVFQSELRQLCVERLGISEKEAAARFGGERMINAMNAWRSGVGYSYFTKYQEYLAYMRERCPELKKQIDEMNGQVFKVSDPEYNGTGCCEMIPKKLELF